MVAQACGPSAERLEAVEVQEEFSGHSELQCGTRFQMNKQTN